MISKPKNILDSLSAEDRANQIRMRDARSKAWYDSIWKTTGKCVFCDLKDKYIIYEENGIALTINLYPYIDGQMMAVPRRHIQSPKELSEKEWDTIRKLNYLAKKLIKKVHGHKGLWTLIREGGERAQMSVTDHLHVQFIPFDNKDLCSWNYRDINLTPIESAYAYKNEMEEIKKLIAKFAEKYTENNS